MTLDELQLAHVGRRVTITSGETVISGPLRGFHVDQDWITELTIGQDPDDAEQIPGRRTVTVDVGPFRSIDLSPMTPVTIA